MKRSEMVEKIAVVIARFKGDLPVSRNDEFIASAVLALMEEEGMKPPGILLKDGSAHQEGYYPDGMPVSEWELP